MDVHNLHHRFAITHVADLSVEVTLLLMSTCKTLYNLLLPLRSKMLFEFLSLWPYVSFEFDSTRRIGNLIFY